MGMSSSLQLSNFLKGVFSLYQVALYFTPWEVVFFKVVRGGLDVQYSISPFGNLDPNLCKSFFFTAANLYNRLLSQAPIWWKSKLSTDLYPKTFNKIQKRLDCDISVDDKK